MQDLPEDMIDPLAKRDETKITIYLSTREIFQRIYTNFYSVYSFQGPKGDRGINPFSPFPRKGLPGDEGLAGLPGTVTNNIVRNNI